jgi:hypothetical protein
VHNRNLVGGFQINTISPFHWTILIFGRVFSKTVGGEKLTFDNKLALLAIEFKSMLTPEMLKPTKLMEKKIVKRAKSC